MSKCVGLEVRRAEFVEVFAEESAIAAVLHEPRVERARFAGRRPVINRACRPIVAYPVDTQCIVEVIGYKLKSIGKLIVVEIEIVLEKNVVVPIA